jgi:hypothetical protein
VIDVSQGAPAGVGVTDVSQGAAPERLARRLGGCCLHRMRRAARSARSALSAGSMAHHSCPAVGLRASPARRSSGPTPVCDWRFLWNRSALVRVCTSFPQPQAISLPSRPWFRGVRTARRRLLVDAVRPSSLPCSSACCQRPAM